ncbi:hypothetical protein Q7Z27_12985, partial [Glaesserella parasuis]|nr:hypothetical protein [Glaesserella parasuis]
ENNEQPTAVPTPEAVVPESTSSETETVSEVKPAEEVVAETSEQPTAVPAPEAVVPESTSSETETVSEVKPAEEV